jgi:hypothetical protein
MFPIPFIVLHPRHKLEYFQAHKWEDGWIETARKITEDEYKCSYIDLDVDTPEYEVPQPAAKKVSPSSN